MPQDQPKPQDITRTQIERRAALRAALGGAAAAAAFTSPRIQGFSVAPDYAAASCVSSVTPTTWPMDFHISGRRCWDGSDFNFGQGQNACYGDRVVNFTAAPGEAGAPDVQATITMSGYYNSNHTGAVSTRGGNLTATVNGVQNHTNTSCSVNAVHGDSCNGWDPWPRSLTQVGSTDSATVTYPLTCDYRTASSNVTVVVTCVCS